MGSRARRTLVIGDVHCPYEDTKAVRRVIEACSDGFSECVINGDFLDMASMSRFGKDRETPSIESELKSARRILGSLRSALGDRCAITYLQGNHELRLSKQLNELMPDLAGLVSIPELLRLDDLGIEYVDSPNPTCYVEREGVLVGHFNRALKGAGKTAVELMRQYGVPVVQGHTHRLASVSLRTYKANMIGAESGCLCQLNPRYADCPDWTHGFVVIEGGIPKTVPIL